MNTADPARPIAPSKEEVLAFLAAGVGHELTLRPLLHRQPPEWANAVNVVGPWIHFEGVHPTKSCGHPKCACIARGHPSMWTTRCRHGGHGAKLWAQETWTRLDGGRLFVYRADGQVGVWRNDGTVRGLWNTGWVECDENKDKPGQRYARARLNKWRPATNLSRKHSRISLEITKLSAERITGGYWGLVINVRRIA